MVFLDRNKHPHNEDGEVGDVDAGNRVDNDDTYRLGDVDDDDDDDDYENER